MKQKECGSSLLEVLVVIVVFGVGILGVVQIFPKALNILKATREGSIAETLAQQKIQQIKKWKWNSSPPEQVKKGFSFDLPKKQSFNPLNWRQFLTPQMQNNITEELIPNQEKLIFCNAVPIPNEVILKCENESLKKVDEETDLTGSKTYFEPKETEGLGIYKVSNDLLKKTIIVEYKATDWRILAEDLLFLEPNHLQYQLSGQNIKRHNELESDNRKYSGFWRRKDFILVNLLNGNIISRDHYDIDYQKGIILPKLSHFPFETPIRAYYQKKGDWFLQVLRTEINTDTNKNPPEKWIVRVYWNSNYFRFKIDPSIDKNTINKWTDQYKMIELELF